ncbi:MAG: IPExxxVDY family protein [Ferruginibacter sp.]
MKLKIDTDTLIDDFFDCTRLFGIVAPVKDYLFSWNINRALGYKLRINHSIEIQLKKKDRNYFFPIYEFPVSGCCMVHYLYNNRNDGEYLLPEFKHLDYLWLAKGEPMEPDEVLVLQQSLKLLPAVQLVTEMTNEKIKNKQFLIF